MVLSRKYARISLFDTFFYSNYAKNTSHIAPFCPSPHRLIILCEQNLDNAAILRYDSSNVSIFVHWYKGEV